jgi:hypothetical protein
LIYINKAHLQRLGRTPTFRSLFAAIEPQEASMNYSKDSADRSTQLKIVAVASVAGIAVAGLASRANSDAASSQTAGAFKAGKPMAMTRSDALVTR